MANKDYYKTLGLQKGASVDEVRKAFKKLARKYHPDVNPGDKKAEDKFKEISEAYDVLSDPAKKKKYDTYGNLDFEGFGAGSGGAGPDFSGSYRYSTRDFDFGDIFGDIFGGGAARKSRGRGFGEGPSSFAPQRGKDIQFSMELDLVDAIKGAEKSIRLPNGSTFKVKIPAGVKDGSKIRLSGKGEPGLYGGPAGDLYLEPRIKPHPYFRVEGMDIFLEVPINLSEAIKGAKVTIPTPDGSVDLKIPPGTQSGDKLRLKGRGVPDVKKGTKGDLFVVAEVRWPKGLDETSQKKLIELVSPAEEDPRRFLQI